MSTIAEVFPDADTLATLPVTDVAPVILRLAREFRPRPGHVHVQDIIQQIHGRHDRKGYSQDKKPNAERAINAAWHWLKREGLLIPLPDPDGGSGWHDLSDEGERIAAGASIDSFVQAAAFPKALLHRAIADDVWRELARGEYDNAVLKCMRAVEEAVRLAGGFGPDDYGVNLMRAAFKPQDGRLADMSLASSEREALMNLFCGAIGWYKNPQSHRSVRIDAAEAREVAVMASNLLRIVDSRSRPAASA